MEEECLQFDQYSIVVHELESAYMVVRLHVRVRWTREIIERQIGLLCTFPHSMLIQCLKCE